MESLAIDHKAMIEQLAFEKEADAWIDAIAEKVKDNNHLYMLLQKFPHNGRPGLYNALQPRLKFKVKPYFLFV